jgi:hypothetical protein
MNIFYSIYPILSEYISIRIYFQKGLAAATKLPLPPLRCRAAANPAKLPATAELQLPPQRCCTVAAPPKLPATAKLPSAARLPPSCQV